MSFITSPGIIVPPLTAGGVAYGTGSQAKVNSAGSSGNVLLSAGAGVPTWGSGSGSLVTSFSGASTGLTPATATTGAISLAGILAIANGGTGTSSTTFTNLTTNVTGTLPVSKGGTGLSTTPANGELDIGNGTGFTRNTLTAGTGITVTNTSGIITIAASGGSAVTSVAQSFTGGLISVAGSPITSSGTLALTVAGTSGGIPYFTSANAWATSAQLTQYGIVYGGGAGATPVATAAGTTGQVLTATTGGAPSFANPVFNAATQAQMEAATNNVVTTTPLATNWHPGVAKAWIMASGDGTTINASHNVSSITDTAAGQLTVNLTTAFSSTSYVIVATSGQASRFFRYACVENDVTTTGSFLIFAGDVGAVKDPDMYYIACFGDQ